MITQEIQPTFLRGQCYLIAITNRNNPSLSFTHVCTISQFTIPRKLQLYSSLSSHRNKDIRLWSRISSRGIRMVPETRGMEAVLCR